MAIKKISLQPILPIRAVPEVSKIQQIKPTQAVQPIYGFQSIQAKKDAYYNNQKQIQTFLSNYNDPTELNSYIDALTNREAVSKKFGETWGTVSTISGTVSVLSFAGSIIAAALATFVPVTAPVTAPLATALATTGKITAIPAIPAAIDVTYNTGIKPIFAGKSGEALLNTMMNFGETMDYVANPIKGLILEGSEGFVKGTGLAKGGRVNYDYDTGFFLTDMLLEMVTDPMNWVDYGSGAVLKGATKAVAEPVARNVADSAIKTVNNTFAKTMGEISSKGAENIFKQTSEVIAQVSREWAGASADGFVKQAEKLARQSGITKPFKFMSKTEQAALIKQVKERMLHDGRNKIQRSLVGAIKKELPKASSSEIALILKQAGREAADAKALTKAMKEISDITFDTLSSDVIKGLSNIQHASDSFQKFMTKGALRSSGFGLGIEAAIDGWKSAKAWANNLTIRNLKKPSLFDQKKGLDIKKYSEGKNIWKATHQYSQDVAGVVSQRDENSFYVFIQQQFNRDKQLISKIFQETDSPLKVAAQLDSHFQALYGCNFKEYIGYIKGINDAENGIYKVYTNYLENLNKTLESNAFTKPMGASIGSGKNLFNVNDRVASKVIEQLTDLMSTQDFNKLNLTEKLYTIKLNNAYVTAELLKNPIISEVLDKIDSDENIGALLDKIANDLNARKAIDSAVLLNAVQTIKEAGKSFSNIRRLYDDIAKIALEKVDGISDKKLRYYILDQIFGENKTVSEALAAFDSVTMPALKNGLETLLYDKQFKIANYPALEEQIARVYKQFLEAQQAAGVQTIGATVVQNFTDSVEDLIKCLPDYASELSELAVANNTIKAIMHNIRETNLHLLENIFTTKGTILGLLNVRELTDAGLALKTVADSKILDMFKQLPNSGSLVKSAQRLGKSINKMVEDLLQYNVIFTPEMQTELAKTYKAFRKQFLDNPDFTAYLDMPAFAYLKNTKNAYEQFAQMAEFYKLIKEDPINSKLFKGVLRKKSDISDSVFHNILNPKALLTTDYVFNPMATSAWIAEKQLNEQLVINSIGAYRNLGLYSKKITNDFQAMRDLLSANKLDRVKMLQQERYIKVASKFNDLFEDFEQVYDNIFDHEAATQCINQLREVLNARPDLNEKYSKLVDQLERFLQGIEQFEQSPKHMQGTAEFVDTYTPFHQQVTQMYQDIISALAEDSSQFKEVLSQRLKEAFAKLKEDFKKQYKISEIKNINAVSSTYGKGISGRQRSELYANTIDTEDGKVPSAMWIRTRSSDVPYTETDYYPELQDKQHIIGETYKEKYGSYDTTTAEFFKDKDYAQSRVDYNNAYEDAAHVITGVKNLLLAGGSGIMSYRNVKELKADFDTVLEDISCIWEDGNRLFIPELAVRYKPILEDLLENYSDELQEALDYAKDITQWGPKHYELRKKFYAQFSKKDQELLRQVDRAVSSKQAWYYTNHLDFSDAFKKKMRVQMDTIDPNYKGYKRTNLSADFARLKNKARGQKFYEGPLKKMSDDLRKGLGERNKAILNERFKPISERIYQQTLDEFQANNIKLIMPWEAMKKQQELNKLINKATDINAKGAFYNLFSLTPDAFKNELAYRFRFITFKDEDIADNQLSGMFKKFVGKDGKNLPEGVKHIHKDNRHWFVLTTDKTNKIEMKGRQAYLNGNPVMRLQNKKQFNELRLVDDYIKDTAKVSATDTLNELDDAMEMLTGTRLGDSQGEFVNKESLETLFRLNAEGRPEYLPDEVWEAFGGTISETNGVRKYTINFDEVYDAGQFDAPRFNESILGSVKSKNALGMRSSNLIVNARNAITQAQFYLKPKNEYVNTVFDSMHSISSPNSIWANFSDEDLLHALQTNPEYRLVALVDDKKYGVKVREIIPTSIEAIQKAKELGAVIVPMQTFKDMYNVVNHRLGSEGMAKLWSRIMYVYKFGYLCRPGAWIRNFVDTNLKSVLEMGDEYKSYNDLAHRILNDVDNMKKFVQARSKDGIIRSDAIQEYFAQGFAKTLTYEQFLELDSDFLSQGISGNIMADMYKTAGGDVWNTFTELTGNIIEAGNKTENYNRLATYLYELDHGADYTTALSKLAKTHFDYSFKTKAEQLAEMVFPFTTFSMRNYSYWIEMLEKHPWIMRNYVHLMKPSWDFKDYTPEELARDYRVQNQILNGQLKLAEFNDKVLTFKANPSIQDAISMFSDPINNVYEKLAAPISVPLDLATGEYTQPLNILPVVGPITQSAKTMFGTGSPLPSAIGVQPKPKRTGVDFRNKNLSGINTYRDEQYRTPKYRNNVVYDSYATRGVNRYRTHMYPVIDIAHDIKMKYTVNVYNRIKNKVKVDVYNGIRYRIKLDANRFR